MYNVDYPDFYDEKLVTAKKMHWCVEDFCRRTRTILPGMQYHRISGKWDGEVSSIKVCKRCWNLRHKLTERLRDIPFGELLEAIKELRYNPFINKRSLSC